MSDWKAWARENAEILGQILCFAVGKMLMAIVQLPNSEKLISYNPLLIIAAVFFLSAFVLKLIKEKGRVCMLLKVYIRQFLIWVVALLQMIFTFSLSHELGWNSLEIVTMTIGQILASATLVVMCSWQFIHKLEFIIYEFMLSINIIALGVKTVIYIEYDLQSPHKDIVLLNLTTKIALTILFMDAIQRAYSKSLTRRPPQNNLVEQEMSPAVV